MGFLTRLTTNKMKEKRKHLRFIIGLFTVPIYNIHSWWTGKWVYIWITPRQFWVMIYKDMDRIEAANYLTPKSK